MIKIYKDIAAVKEVIPVMDETFANPKKKWEIIDDEDEHSWIDEQRYHIENLTETRWNYYHVDSGLDLKREDFIIETEIRVIKHGDYYSFGIVFGFDKYPTKLNRFVFSPGMNQAVVAAFLRNENSTSIERFSKTCTQIETPERYVRFVMIKLCERIYFFINNMDIPILELDASLFFWTGDRVGFYIEPELKIAAKNFSVRKIVGEKISGNNFQQLVQDKKAKRHYL